jgi:hypothetical protein
VFYIGVAKVDWDVERIAMAIYTCLKCMFQMFQLFQTYVGSVSSRCCKSRFGCCIYMYVANVCFKCFSCFIRTLQMFHLNVVYVCNGYTRVFLTFHKYVASVSTVSDVCCKCFIWMLQK